MKKKSKKIKVRKAKTGLAPTKVFKDKTKYNRKNNQNHDEN